MESPAPTPLTRTPFGASCSDTVPSSATSTAPSPDPGSFLQHLLQVLSRIGLLRLRNLLRSSRHHHGTAAVAGDVPYAGGRTRKNRLIEPDPAIPVPCYTFNGYLVLVPKAVFRALGNLDPFYRHNFGDYDYGVRAMKAGISRVVAPGILADYYGKRELPRWRDAAYSLKERYAFMLSPLGRPPQEQFHYDCRSMGFFGAVWHFITQNLSVLFPKRADRSLTNNS